MCSLSFLLAALEPTIGSTINSRVLSNPMVSVFVDLIATCACKFYRNLAFLNLFWSCNHSNKAVADGAVSFYLDHFVAARMSKIAYGVECSIPFDPTDKEHFNLRSPSMFISLAGVKQLPGAFSVILGKVRRS